VYDILERLKNGEKIDHFETMRVAKDGHLLAVSLTMSPIRDAQGQMIGASTIAHDITRTKLAAQSLRNAEDMAAVGRMASTVAHEINNPLQAVANALYLLAGSPSLDASARQFLAIAQDQLAKIATVPLGLSRAEAEHHPPILVSHRDSAA
jgi:signal transduction histidine kinase